MSWWRRLFGQATHRDVRRLQQRLDSDWSQLIPATDGTGQSPSADARNEPEALRTANRFADKQTRGQIYDPALQHFAGGFVHTAPKFDSASDQAQWALFQQEALNLVFRAIAQSPASQHLVLRGSALMQSWYGLAARTPKDLDFVVVPMSISRVSDEAIALIEMIVAAVANAPQPQGKFMLDHVARDSIWTYNRVDGQRLTFFWKRGSFPWGSVQVDITFGERLPTPSVETPVQLQGDTTPVLMQSADKATALAWKLCWLQSDSHPRAKDLYDAMLLAEDGAFDLTVVEPMFAEQRESTLVLLRGLANGLRQGSLEWVGFEQEDRKSARIWADRLREALPPPPPALAD